MEELVCNFVIPAAYELLPSEMNSEAATAMMLAIGFQESRFRYRQQIMGPARGFWQFEAAGGCLGILTHEASATHLNKMLRDLQYADNPHHSALHGWITNNDILAAGCARLLLWTDPKELPAASDGPEVAWNYYLRNWRPGKPHRETWDEFWGKAWDLTYAPKNV